MSSFYELLGVSPVASEHDIRKAYRNKAKQYHPDINNSLDANQNFFQIHKAYKTLIDKDKRFFYDQKIKIAYNQQRAQDKYSRFYNYSYYNQWAHVQKEKAEQEARHKQEEFIRNRDKFKSSLLYYPSIGFIYVATFFCFLLGLCVLSICFFLIYKIHLVLLFFLSPFICGGIYFMKCTADWFIESKKYF